MLSFKASIATFWQENDAYIAVYAAFALLACLVISGFEFHNRTSSTPYTALLVKAVALTLGTSAVFSLWMFVIGWHARLLGGEIFTSLAIGAVWYAALYFLNVSLRAAFAVSLEGARFYAHLPVVVLIVPCFLFYAFIVALGSGWRI
jgi:hypothetical protein